MDDEEVWEMGEDGMLTSLSPTYRLAAATGPNAGDVFPASLLVFKDAAGNYIAGGPVAAADGTAGAPAFTFSNDLDTGIFRSAANALGFSTAGVERMTITAAGLIGIGTSSPQGVLHVVGSSLFEGNASLTKAGQNCRLTIGSATNYGYAIEATDDDLSVFNASSALRLKIRYSTGAIEPGEDNGQALGAASARYSGGYAGSNWVITCDMRFKAFRVGRDPTEAEHAAALECFDAFGFYQFNDAIEAKGPDGARWHYGPAAQEVWAIWASHGLTDALGEDGCPVEGCVPPAFLCFDEIEEETAPVMEGWRPSAVLDADGQPVMVKCGEGEEATEQRPTGEMIVTREAGHIFGVRIDQLHSLMLVALNAKLKALAAKVALLEAGV